MAKYWMAMIFALLCVACAARGAEPRPGTPAGTGIAPPTRIPDPVESTLAPQSTPVTIAEMPQEVRRAVADDAARRFNVAASAVVLASAEQVTWPDGSLGCPQPGRMYTQNLVAGFRVVAKTAAGELTYHTDTRGNVVNCASRILPRKAVEQGPAAAQPRTTPTPPTPDR